MQFIFGTLTDLADHIQTFGWQGHIVLLGLFAASGGLSLLPRPVICVVAGAAYGFWSIPTAFAGILLGTSLAYCAGRFFSQRMVFLLGRHPKILAIMAAIYSEGWKAVLLMRLVPGLPSGLLSIAFGLSKIRYGPFCLATLAGIAPGILMAIAVGMTGSAAIKGELAFMQLCMAGLGIAAGGAALLLIARQARRNIALYTKGHR